MAEENELVALLAKKNELLRSIRRINHDMSLEAQSIATIAHNAGRDEERFGFEDPDLLNRQTVDSAVLAGKIEELRNIKLVVEQVESGKGRRCVDCSRQITAKRLEAQPYAIRCRSCQKKFEEAKKRKKS